MYGWLVFGALYVFAIVWCYFVIRSIKEHVREIRQLNDMARISLIVVAWGMALVCGVIVINYTYVVICKLVEWIG